MIDWVLENFVRESNKIEGIERDDGDPQFQAEVEAHHQFLHLTEPTVGELERFVRAVTARSLHPGTLRRLEGMNVRVGAHVPPAGGPGIKVRLEALLEGRGALRGALGAYATHIAYEHLHPFTDGNGRSGRVLWLLQMGGTAPLGFLHQFYYQTLEAQGDGS